MKKPSPNEIVGEFVLSRSHDLPVAKRISLYRAMGEMIGDESDARQFIAIADDLASAELKVRQLALNFGKGGSAS